MDMPRICRHLITTRWRVKRAFPAAALCEIEKAIKASETAHRGEICFVVEGSLDGLALLRGQTARERAIDVFSQLRIWDTEHNNGVLIYLLMADRAVEIVVDRGLHAKANTHEWEPICRKIEADFRDGHFERGTIAGIKAVALHLTRHFPPFDGDINALPDRPVVLA